MRDYLPEPSHAFDVERWVCHRMNSVVMVLAKKYARSSVSDPR